MIRKMPQSPLAMLPELRAIKIWRNSWLLTVLFGLLCVAPILRVAVSAGGQYEGIPALRVAGDFLAIGTLTDGQGVRNGLASGPGRAVAPGYPVFVASVASIDARSHAALECLTNRRLNCSLEDPFRNLIIAQAVLSLLSLVIAYRIFQILSQSQTVASLATLLFCKAAHTTDLVSALGPLAPAQFCVLAYALLLFEGYLRSSLILIATAGFVLGIGCLFTPNLLILAGIALPTVSTAIIYGRQENIRVAIATSAAFWGGLFLMILPWCIRNQISFGDPAWTWDSGTNDLAMRLAYNNMGIVEWSSAITLWTPIVGTEFWARIIPTSIYESVESFKEGSRLQLDYIRLSQSLPDGPPLNRVGFLLSEITLAEANKHIATSIATIWRGLWGGSGMIGLIGAFLVVPFLRIHLRLGKLTPVALVFFPFICLAVINGLLTPNTWAFNLMMPAAFAYIVGYVAGDL